MFDHHSNDLLAYVYARNSEVWVVFLAFASMNEVNLGINSLVCLVMLKICEG